MSAFKHSAVSFGTSDTPPPEAGRNIGPISLHNAIGPAGSLARAVSRTPSCRWRLRAASIWRALYRSRLWSLGTLWLRHRPCATHPRRRLAGCLRTPQHLLAGARYVQPRGFQRPQGLRMALPINPLVSLFWHVLVLGVGFDELIR